MPVPGSGTQTLALKRGLGIYLRLYPTGDHQWYWRGSTKRQGVRAGTAVWVHIGPFNVASWTVAALQDEAVRLRGLARRGINPNKVVPASQPEEIPTLQEAWDKFCLDFLPTRSEAYANGQKATWRRHVAGENNDSVKVANFPSIPLDKVSTATCIAILQPLISKGQYTTANRARSLLSKLCNWCRGLYPALLGNAPNWIAASPKQEENPEERTLSEAELKLFGKGWKASSALHKHTILWLLLTGSRGGLLQAYNSAWERGECLLIPKGTKKVKKARFVIMGKHATKLLPDMHLPVSVNGLRHAMDDIAAKGGIKGKCSPRTLRKTFSSLGADWGEMQAAIEFIQNHKGSSIQQAYLQRALDPLIPVVDRISTQMLKLMGIRIRR